MTTIGEVRVQPLTLEETYSRMKEAIDRDAG